MAHDEVYAVVEQRLARDGVFPFAIPRGDLYFLASFLLEGHAVAAGGV
ncbi:MAG: hypothetical protein LUC18_03530 [Porphyromonadaceae bacterium]|nr:hypothetical protein [Porphyromonadaceae bacterium]